MAIQAILLGRQVILDSDLRSGADALLFRIGDRSGGAATGEMEATARVIRHAFSETDAVLQPVESVAHPGPVLTRTLLIQAGARAIRSDWGRDRGHVPG